MKTSKQSATSSKTFLAASLCALGFASNTCAMSETRAATAPVAAAVGQVVATSQTPPEDVTFESVLDLKQAPPEVTPKLRNGELARSADWPASFYATFTTPEGTAACTSALVGPQVMLTAAHCVPDSGLVMFKFGSDAYTTNCVRHPRYAVDPSADYALCALTTDFKQPVGFVFESIDTTSTMSALTGKPIVLTGYGCLDDAVHPWRSDNKYRFGSNTIDETSASNTRSRGARYYLPDGERNNLFTADSGANLCPGDSGGPAFQLSAGANPNRILNRKIVGVNSRVFYTDATKAKYGSSLVSSTGGSDFREWAEKWASSRGLAACGLNGQLANCRN